MELITHILPDATSITGAKGDHIINQIIKSNNYYEGSMLNYIRETVPYGVMIDVGSNIGNHTLFLAKYCATEVISFEPFPVCYDLLERNIILNNITNVRLMNIGLSNVAKEVLMDTVEGNLGMAKINEEDTVKEGNKRWVKVVPFDKYYLKGIKDRVTLIKLDCEGYELRAIEGMLELIERDKPILFIECQDDIAITATRQFLFQYGYKDVRRFNATPTYEFIHKGK